MRVTRGERQGSGAAGAPRGDSARQRSEAGETSFDKFNQTVSSLYSSGGRCLCRMDCAAGADHLHRGLGFVWKTLCLS